MSASSLDHSPVQQQLQVMQKQMAKMQSEISQLLSLTRSQARLSSFSSSPVSKRSDAIDDTAAVSSLSPEKEEGMSEASRLRRRRLRFFERTKQEHHARGDGELG